MSGASSSFLRPARQRRSRRSLERIIEALDALIEEKTFEEITVTEVCKRAEVGVGTFYDRVGSKESLLEHLRQRLYAETIEQVERAFAPARFEGMSLAATLAVNATEMVALHLGRQGAMRALIVEARRSVAFAAHARELNTVLMTKVTAVWLAKRAEFRPAPSPHALARSAFLMATGFLREAMIWDRLWPGETEAAQIGADLHHLLHSFLLSEAPRPS